MKDFNIWWDGDDFTTPGNPFTDGTFAYWAWEGWCAGVKAEREACAKMCEEEADDEMYLGLHYAEAIRTRSNT